MLTGDQESSASVHVANVGKPPEVAQADGEAQAGQEELAVVVPLASLRPLGLGLGDLEFFFRHLFRHFRGKSFFFLHSMFEAGKEEQLLRMKFSR